MPTPVRNVFSGDVVEEGQQEGDACVGEWRWTVKGVFAGKGSYERGTREGRWLWYWSNGQVYRDAMYANDLLHGPCTEYFSDGKVKARGAFTGVMWPQPFGGRIEPAGIQSGAWETFHPSGQKASEGSYGDGQPEGPFAGQSGGWPPFHWIYGWRWGAWKEWNEAGALILDATYKNGFPEGELKRLVKGEMASMRFKQGLPDLTPRRIEGLVRRIKKVTEDSDLSHGTKRREIEKLVPLPPCPYESGPKLLWHLTRTGALDTWNHRDLFQWMLGAPRFATDKDVLFVTLKSIESPHDWSKELDDFRKALAETPATARLVPET